MTGMSNSRAGKKLEWPYVAFIEKRGAWQVDARTKTGGSRRFFKTRAEAETFAAQCRTTRGNQGVSAFGNVELAKYGKTVQWAVEFALEHLRSVEKSVSVADAMEALIEARRAAGRSETYCYDLRRRLSRFQKGFPDATVATITAADIDAWLTGLNMAPGTRNTFRRDIRTLFSYCKKRKWVTANEAMATERAKDIDKPASILTPGQAASLLSKCGDDLIPFVAVGLFAGLRSSELQKLDWSQVDLDGGHIEVKAAQSKTARRRLIPIAENLRAWLEPVRQIAGPITPRGKRKRFQTVREAAGFKSWENNVLRHSFGSYRLSQCQDAARVSLEMGNSPQMVFSHYRELVKPKDAELYWKIMPGGNGANVVAFEASAA